MMGINICFIKEKNIIYVFLNKVPLVPLNALNEPSLNKATCHQRKKRAPFSKNSLMKNPSIDKVYIQRKRTQQALVGIK